MPWTASSSSLSSVSPVTPDRADDLAFVVTDQHAAALREDLIAARGNEVSHEDRPLLRALANELRAAAERERRISLSIGHFEMDHRRSVFFLERFHFAARLDHDHAQRPAIQCGAALNNGVDNAFGQIEGDGSHGGSSPRLCQLLGRDSIAAMRRASNKSLSKSFSPLA